VGRANGVDDEKLIALMDYTTSELYSEPERLALTYADRITLTDQDVDDELFERLREVYSPEEIVELTCTVAFENFLSKFHHALLVESQGFCPVVLPRQSS
jgi:alkylhydroperoxidase family enzyme